MHGYSPPLPSSHLPIWNTMTHRVQPKVTLKGKVFACPNSPSESLPTPQTHANPEGKFTWKCNDTVPVDWGEGAGRRKCYDLSPKRSRDREVSAIFQYSEHFSRFFTPTSLEENSQLKHQIYNLYEI